MTIPTRLRRALSPLALAGALVSMAGCGGGTPAVVPDQQADAYLFAQGAQALERSRWLTSREYFRRLVDTYPTSQFRQDARLGIGDSYLGERRVESDVLAVGEFREFLRFYPLASRADYAQFRLAYGQVRQVLSPERDQTATLDALRELRAFLTNYPTSKYTADVLKLERQMRDRLSESELMVGRHYLRSRWYVGAVSRLEALLKDDPQYAGRDGVYFFLAEAYNKQNKTTEARGFYQKVIDEFRVSDYLEDAGKRLAQLGSATVAGTTPAPAAAPPVSQTTPAATAQLPAPAGSSTPR